MGTNAPLHRASKPQCLADKEMLHWHELATMLPCFSLGQSMHRCIKLVHAQQQDMFIGEDFEAYKIHALHYMSFME